MIGKLLLGLVGTGLTLRIAFPAKLKELADKWSYGAGRWTAKKAIEEIKKPAAPKGPKGETMASVRAIAKSQFAKGVMDESLTTFAPGAQELVQPVTRAIKQLRKIKL